MDPRVKPAGDACGEGIKRTAKRGSTVCRVRDRARAAAARGERAGGGRRRRRWAPQGAAVPDAPHLAGQPEQYLVKSLNEYRSGARKHDMMTLVAKALSDQDVADLAAYYAAIEISATPPK
jgi:mono/diheme cytochrome c family protein